MKKKIVRSIICFLLAVIMITESNVGVIASYASEMADEADVDDATDWETEEEDIPLTASNYLYPLEEAVTALEELAADRVIQGVIYLEDEVTLRTLPEEASEPVKILYSGDVVSILGAGQDAEYNIWYQVSYKTEVEEVQGYVRRDNVACVDEELLQWQDNYVRSIAMFSLRRSRYSYSDIAAFPESYQDALIKIKEEHPNWIFIKMNTGINWATAVNSQYNERSLIENYVKSSWKNGLYGSSGWSYASKGIIEYFMDPRNWLSEQDIFQFELLGYYSEYHTEEAVEDILAGTFMAHKTIDNGKTYAQTFVELGEKIGISPFLLASRIRQEQGANGDSALISGQYEGSDGKYKGYYNYFNIKASGKTTKEIVETGLAHAKSKGWDSRYEALKGGAEFLMNGYIGAGQDTLYLQKFDVDNRYNSVFWHQYMQNIRAPYYEARTVYKTYNEEGLLDQGFIFRIPVYTNMSSRAAVAPGDEDVITLSSTSIDNLQVGKEVTLRPYINGKEAQGMSFEFTSSDPSVATVDNNGVVKALKAGSTTITCVNPEDTKYTIAGACEITVVQTQIDMSQVQVPELESIIYDPNGTLSQIKLPEGYTWVNPDMVPMVSQSSYSVTYNPDEDKYIAITFDITLEVTKRSYTSSDYTIPMNLEGGATRELSSVILPNGFMWDNPEEVLPDTIGTVEYSASYNPDVENYETVEGIKIPVKVVCEKHDFAEWKITEATCEEEGLKQRTCKTCDSKEELVLESLGHDYEGVVTTEATEEAEGVRTYTCSRCKDSYTESIPKLPSTHVHEYEENITKKASCTENGTKEYTCSCGDKYNETITATGHKMENGLCKQCGYTEPIETPPASSEDADKDADEKPDEDVKEEQDKDADDSSSSEEKDDETTSTDKESNNGSVDSSNTNSGNSQTTPPTSTTETTVNNGSTSGGSTEQTPSTSTTETTVNNSGTSGGNTEQTPSTSTTETTVNNNSTSGGSTEQTSSNTNETKTENTTELELMSNLIEKAEDETTDGEKKTIAIQLNKNTDISQKIVEMAKENNVNLEVSLPNNLKWTIKADSLGDDMPSSINMNAQIVQNVIDQEIINTVVAEEDYMELSLSHDGTFGFVATLTVPVEKKYIGKTANLFYFNEQNREMEFVMAAPVEEDGNIVLDFNHASDYVIVFAEKSMEDSVKPVETLHNDGDLVTEETRNNESQEKQDSISNLITICVIILLVSGGIALIGFFLCRRHDKPEEIDDTNTFEEWLKEDTTQNTTKDSKKVNVANSTEYFDDDKDDYREKEVDPGKTFHTGEIHLEEDYLDEDVDDYQEKHMDEKSEEKEEYFDEDVDDYKEKEL